MLVNKEVGLKDLFPTALGEDADYSGDGAGDERLPLYFDGENVSGKVSVRIRPFLHSTQCYKRRDLGTRSAEEQEARTPWYQDRICGTDRSVSRPLQQPRLHISRATAPSTGRTDQERHVRLRLLSS